MCEAWAVSLKEWLEANWMPRTDGSELVRVAPNALVRRDMVRRRDSAAGRDSPAARPADPA